MKWSNKQKEKLKVLCFAEKSNKEISEIMGISLNDVYAGRSRFGITKVLFSELEELGGTIVKAGISKEELVKSLEFTLKLTREKIDSLELIDDETVVIHYESGYGQKVNIACDSGMVIIRDVAKAID